MMTPWRRRTSALAAALLSTALVLTACGSDDDGSRPASDDSQAVPDETQTFQADNGAIAPTIFYTIEPGQWKEKSATLAEALGVIDVQTQQKEAYEAVVADLREKYGEAIDSMTFAAVNQWGSDPGSFYREYANSTCTTYAGDAGLQFPGAAQDAANGAPFEEISVERLGELSEFDAVLYPLGPDGKPTPAIVPLLESNAWKSLPLVQSDKALPGGCVTVTFIQYVTAL